MVGITRSKVILIFHDTFHINFHIIHGSSMQKSIGSPHLKRPVGKFTLWAVITPGSPGSPMVRWVVPLAALAGLMDVYSTSKYGIMMYGMWVNPKSIGQLWYPMVPNYWVKTKYYKTVDPIQNRQMT